MEGTHGPKALTVQATLGAIIMQIMVLDLLFSLDSVIIAIGIPGHLKVTITSVVIAILVMDGMA